MFSCQSESVGRGEVDGRGNEEADWRAENLSAAWGNAFSQAPVKEESLSCEAMLLAAQRAASPNQEVFRPDLDDKANSELESWFRQNVSGLSEEERWRYRQYLAQLQSSQP